MLFKVDFFSQTAVHGFLHGAEDVLVAGAAAEVAGEQLAQLLVGNKDVLHSSGETDGSLPRRSMQHHARTETGHEQVVNTLGTFSKEGILLLAEFLLLKRADKFYL